MNITNEALQAMITTAYEQGYTMGYNLGRCEKDDNDEYVELTYGDIYKEFKSEYPNFVKNMVNYRPYKPPYASESKELSILLYMKNGDEKRYDYVTKRLYPVYKDEEKEI